MRHHVLRERILVELLDTQRNPLPLGIDRQHHGFQLIALGIGTNRFFARDVPGDVGQMHQPVDTAFQPDEDTEVGDRFDLAGDMIALLVRRRELIPGVGQTLLHAQRDAPTFLVDVENHDFDFLRQMHHLGRVDVLVGPVHFRDVHQTFDTILDLDETAIIGDIGDLAEQAGAFRITARQIDPGILAQLLEPQ